MLNFPELIQKYPFFIDDTGLHYHYNISIGFDCDKALPVFLLFCPQSKSLIGFGWGGPFHVSSDEWEKPSPLVFGVRKGQVNLNGKRKKYIECTNTSLVCRYLGLCLNRGGIVPAAVFTSLMR